MNKRIEELTKQAYEYAQNEYSKWNANDSYDGIPFIRKIYTEKLVELIVSECAEVAGCNAHVSGFSLGDLIKEHFEVK
jgi:hypothetical protein